MAHKKGQGSTRNGRDSRAQRLGIKKFGGEAVSAQTPGGERERQAGDERRRGDPGLGAQPPVDPGDQLVSKRVDLQIECLVGDEVAPTARRPIHQDRSSFHAVGLFELTAQPCADVFDAMVASRVSIRQPGAVAAGCEPVRSVPASYDGSR